MITQYQQYIDEGDVEQGKDLLKQAANQGYVAAQFNLCVLLYDEGDVEQGKDLVGTSGQSRT